MLLLWDTCPACSNIPSRDTCPLENTRPEAPGDLVPSSCAFHSWLQLPSWGFQQGRWRTPTLSRGGIPDACVDITQASPSFYFKMNLPQSSQLKVWRENHICLLSFPLQKPLFFFFFCLLRGVWLWREIGAPLPFWLIRAGQGGTRVRAERHMTCRAPSANCFLSFSPLNTQTPNYRLSWRKRRVETESWGFEWRLQGSTTLFICSSALDATTTTGGLLTKIWMWGCPQKDMAARADRELNEAPGLSLSVLNLKYRHAVPWQTARLFPVSPASFFSLVPHQVSDQCPGHLTTPKEPYILPDP